MASFMSANCWSYNFILFTFIYLLKKLYISVRPIRRILEIGKKKLTYRLDDNFRSMISPFSSFRTLSPFIFPDRCFLHILIKLQTCITNLADHLEY